MASFIINPFTGDLIPSNSDFTQSGTGAIQRTVDSKLKDVVSVKDFGAVGDGTTNDTTAFAAAFANLNAGSAPKSLYIPSGNYLVNHSTCTITSNNRTLFGDGLASRIIIASVAAGAWGIKVDGTSASVHVTDVLIADLAVVASGWTGANGENGISVNRADRCSVQRCQVVGSSAGTSWEQGIIFRDTNSGLIENNIVQRIAGNGISLDLQLGSEDTRGNLVVGNTIDFVGDSGIGFHNNVRYSSAIGNIIIRPGQVVGGTGIDIAGCQYCQFSGNKISNSAQFGIRLLQNLSYSTVDNIVSNNTVEHPSTATDAAIVLADCNRNTVVDNVLICNTAAKNSKGISIFYTTNATQTHPVTGEAIEKLSGSVIKNNTISRFTTGILLDAGGGITVANFIVDGNVLRDCTTGIGFTTASGEKRFTLYGHNYYSNCTNNVSSVTGGIAVNSDPLYDTISSIPCNVSTAGIETTVTSALVVGRIPSTNQVLLGFHMVTENGGWDGAINYKSSSGSILVSDIFGTVTNAIRSSVIPLASDDLITITINKTNLSPGVSGIVECTGLSLALLTYY
jgi:parallel beta-helix repeat protein